MPHPSSGSKWRPVVRARVRGKNKKGFLRLSNDEVAMIEGDEDFSGSEIELLDISHMSGSSGGAKEPIETRRAVVT